jgi:chitinase
MAKEKAHYIMERSLGGAMWWELSGDKTDDNGSIVTNVSLPFISSPPSF